MLKSQAINLLISTRRKFSNSYTIIKFFFGLKPYFEDPFTALVYSLYTGFSSGSSNVEFVFHIQNLEFYARPKDKFTLEEILIKHEYNFLPQLITDSNKYVILDLGANIGLFSLYTFSQIMNCRIYAFEPSNSTYNILVKNSKINPQLEWEVYNYAIWSKNGTVNIHNNTFSTASRIAFPGEDYEIVPSINLSNIIETIIQKPVDIMKMDIEGAEEDVLCGNEEILNSIKCSVIEIHPNRCNQYRVLSTLNSKYKYIYRIAKRNSSKPLIIGSNRSLFTTIL